MGLFCFFNLIACSTWKTAHASSQLTINGNFPKLTLAVPLLCLPDLNLNTIPWPSFSKRYHLGHWVLFIWWLETQSTVFELIMMNSLEWQLQSTYKMLVKISLSWVTDLKNASRHKEVDETIWLQLHLQNRCCTLPDQSSKWSSEYELYV